MVWGQIRIVLFTIAFIVGMMVIGPLKTSAGSKLYNPQRLDEHMGTSLVVACEGGKVVVSGKITVSADGKTRTVSTKGVDANGKKVATTAVYDKQ